MAIRADRASPLPARADPVTYADPVTMVQDDDDLTMLYLKPGTPIKIQVGPGGLPMPRDIPYRERAAIPRQVGNGTYKWNHTLILVRPGEAHDIRLFWSETDWRFRGWYVNVQRPIIRSSVGFDTADHELDSFIYPDSSWRWKDEDEDEFAEGVEIGRFTEAGAVDFRAEGERINNGVGAGSRPFDAGFEHWRPVPYWPIPTMPEGRDVDV